MDIREISFAESFDNLDAPRMQAIFSGIEHGYKSVQNAYGPNSTSELRYHSVDHTMQVTEDTGAILSVMRNINPSLVTLDDVMLGALFGAFHDSVQKMQFLYSGIKTVQMPFTMNNEIESAGTLADYMVKDASFVDNDRQLGTWSVWATIPTRHNGGVSQMYVDQSVREVKKLGRNPFIPVALAMADLGYPGRMSAVKTIELSNAMFAERSIGIVNHLLDKKGVLKPNEDIYVRSAILAWSGAQASFIQEREREFYRQLLYFPEETMDKVAELFPYFDENRQVVIARHARFLGLSTYELIEEMGLYAHV